MNISNSFSISCGLIWELVSMWDVRSRGFRVRDKIVLFTPIDVCFALGLSIVGKSLVVEEDQQSQTLDLFKGVEVTIHNIRKQLRSHKKILVNFVRLYILLAFAEFYFSKIGYKVFTRFIKKLDDLDSLDITLWFLVYVSLRVLKERKNKAHKHLNGFAAILQIWAFNHLSLEKAPAVSRFSSPVITMQKKNIEKSFDKNMIIDRIVATEEELEYDIVNAALFEQGQQFVNVYDYQRLVDENKDFKERITILEEEMRMMK
ncbi:unnamed protein product [Lathyrus sativus]|nr:unnamed protein product [Lathyrus sativus]